MTRLSMILVLVIFGLSLVQDGWTDCDVPLYNLGRSSPCAVFYVEGEDFQPVTVSGPGETAVDWGVWGVGAVGSGTSVTITKAFMESNASTGVYPVHYWLYGSQGEVLGDLLGFDYGQWLAGAIQAPTAVNTSTKTVSYTCYLNPFPYYDSVNYYVFAPNGSSAGSGSFTKPNPVPTEGWSGSFDITYGSRGPYGIAWEGIGSDLYTGSADGCIRVEGHHVDGAIETPTFGITSVTSSTTTPPWAASIEPAYGDNATFHWRKSCNEFHSQSIVILQEDPSGTIIDPNDPNLKYKIIATSSLADSTNVTEHNAQTTGWYITGDLTWPTPGTHLPEFPSGHHRLGVKFDDEYVDLTNKYVDVCLSVYNVYTDNNAPFYPGQEQQNKTSFGYTLSSEAQACTVKVGKQGEEAEIQGTTSVGQNYLPQAWDGKNKNGQYYHTGQFPTTFAVTPKSGAVGSNLSFQFISQPSSFSPEDGQSLQIDYRLQEPVKRLQATTAKLTAVVYDEMDGHVVRVLADEASAAIDNDPTDSQSAGQNTLIWNGHDESGEIVPPGDYAITLVAEDNAGEGCESTLQVVPAEVLCGDPGCILSVSGSDSEPQRTVNGYTNSENTVTWSDSQGPTGTATPNQDGEFSFEIGDGPGLHTITMTTTRTGYPEKQETCQVFINTLTLNSPLPGSENRFRPDQSETLNITFTSQANDSFDVRVVDPFDSTQCISSTDPVPASVMLNGFVMPKTIRTIWDNHAVSAGQCAVSWDGKDDSGQMVPAGPYIVEVMRHNADGLRSLFFEVAAAVDRTATAPVVSGIHADVQGNLVVVSWTTDVPTTGAILYQRDGIPVAKVPANNPAISHTVYLPVVESNVAYDYWIVAKDSAGHTSVSSEQAFTAGPCESIDDVSAVPVSDTSVDISWKTNLPIVGRKWYVQYAEVGPSISQVQWLRVQGKAAEPDHAIRLNGLTANSEYAFRVIASDDDLFAHATKSPFHGFVTKQTKSSVVITSPEENDVVSGTINVMVQASDPVHRFSSNGITKVELEVDGRPCDRPTHSLGTNEYNFTVDTSKLKSGSHFLRARGTDDFWNESDYMSDFQVETGGGINLTGRLRHLTATTLGVNYNKAMKGGARAVSRARRSNGNAVILVGEYWAAKGSNDEDRDSIFDKVNRRYLLGARDSEYFNYYHWAKLDPIVVYGRDFQTTADLLDFIVDVMDRQKAFTYMGHGDRAILSPGLHLSASASEIITERDERKRSGKYCCRNRLQYLRLLSCLSGVREYDPAGPRLHIEAIKPCPLPANGSVRYGQVSFREIWQYCAHARGF